MIPLRGTKITGLPGLLEPALFGQLALIGRSIRNLPWQRLSESEKKSLSGFADKAIRMHEKWLFKEFPPLRIDTFRVDPSLGKMTLNAWGARSTPERFRQVSAAVVEKTLISGFLRINMAYPKKLLIKKFNEWLNRNHPGGERKAAKGRHSHRDALNQLGALRLRYFYRTLEEAQMVAAGLKSPANENIVMSYGDRKAWNSARKRALKHFRDTFKLPDTSFPIHYREGWPK